MSVDKIRIDKNSRKVGISNLVIREHSFASKLQFLLKNKSFFKHKIDSIELRYYGKNNIFLGAESCFPQSEFIHKKDDVSIDLRIDNSTNFEHATLKIRTKKWINYDVLIPSIVLLSSSSYFLYKVKDAIF